MGVVFHAALGADPDRASYVSAMAHLVGFDLFLIVAAMALSTLLPRRRALPAPVEDAGARLELERV